MVFKSDGPAYGEEEIGQEHLKETYQIKRKMKYYNTWLTPLRNDIKTSSSLLMKAMLTVRCRMNADSCAVNVNRLDFPFYFKAQKFIQ